MSFAVNVHELFWLDVAEARIYYEFVSCEVADDFYKAFNTADRDKSKSQKLISISIRQ